MEGTLPGALVLDDLRSPLGVLLWQLHRDVTLWAATRADLRPRLFAEGAARRMHRAVAAVTATERELGVLLVDLVEAVHGGEPSSPREAAALCHRVAGWAERNGCLSAALAFAQAAASTVPADAGYALSTGLLARRLGPNASTRAEAWLFRAVVVATRGRQPRPWVRAHLELGRLFLDRRDLASARHWFLRAMRRARRCGMAGRVGRALHEMFDLAWTAPYPGDDPEAYARSALASTRDFHDAEVIVRHWVRWHLEREPRSAVLTPADGRRAPFRGTRTARARLLAVVAEEAARYGADDEFDRAWTAEDGLLERYVRSAPEPDPGALFTLARAATRLGRRKTASFLIARMRTLGGTEGDGEPEADAPPTRKRELGGTRTGPNRPAPAPGAGRRARLHERNESPIRSIPRMNTVATIGYEGATVQALVEALRGAGVELLVDVRAVANSRRPGFSKTKLAANVGEAGIDYLHLRALGTPADGRAAARAGRHDELRSIFLEHLATSAAQDELETLVELVRSGRRVCLLCFEADPAHCHRRMVAEALAERLPVRVDDLTP